MSFLLRPRVEAAGSESWVQRQESRHLLLVGGHPLTRGEGAQGTAPSSSISLLLCELQIAPAEGPDVSERMVIITGPPEAQFKVSAKNLLSPECRAAC